MINSGAIAALSIAFTYYVSFIWPLSSAGKTVLSVVTVCVITIANIFRVKVAELFSNLFTGLKLLGIASLFSEVRCNRASTEQPITGHELQASRLKPSRMNGINVSFGLPVSGNS